VGLNPNDTRPPYLQVAADLKRRVTEGELRPGDRLPTIKELTERYGVSPATVQAALRLLREDGVTHSWQGRGTYVSEPSTARPGSQDEAVPSAAEIMSALDGIQDELRDLRDRVARLEKDSRKGRR
jgi:DNA-binding GntR family transcriptional regulator